MTTEMERGATLEESPDSEAERIKQDIEQTRDDLSETVAALEERFSPSQLRAALREEVQEVEQKVRSVLGEQLAEAKTVVQTELREAKDALHGGLADAERRIRSGLHDAKETAKSELKHAVQETKDSVRAATLGRVENLATQVGDTMNDVRDSLLDTIRQNPLPATLAGVGIAWLLMNRSQSASFRTRGYAGNGGTGGEYSTPMGSRAGERVGQMGAALGHATQQAGGAVAQGLHGVAETASGVIEGATGMASEIAHTAAEGVSQAASAVTGSAAALSGSAQAGAKRVEQTVERQLRERPLAVGAAAIAIGTMVGCALPRTRAEDELLGEASSSMMSRAGEMIHEAAASVGIGGDEGSDQPSGDEQKARGGNGDVQRAAGDQPRSQSGQGGAQSRQGEQQKVPVPNGKSASRA